MTWRFVNHAERERMTMTLRTAFLYIVKRYNITLTDSRRKQQRPPPHDGAAAPTARQSFQEELHRL
jgi:hypothetical protein